VQRHAAALKAEMLGRDVQSVYGACQRGFSNGVFMLLLTRNSDPDVPDHVRDLHHQLEAGNDGEDAYE
jgi:hypothetical protein